MKILHIAVHLGGGVGTVLHNWFKNDCDNEHIVLLLNYNYYGEKRDNIYENMRNKYSEINKFVMESDVVIVHFWNHPFLFEFFINCNLSPCRLVIWTHESGLYPPYVHTDNLMEYSDLFILSSPISYPREKNFIWTTGGVNEYLKLKKIKSDKFTIGYVGTLDFSKLYPNFVSLCKQIQSKIPDCKFIICGVGCDEGKIRADVKLNNLDNNFEFKGYVPIKDIVPTFDVFGYPLNQKHFGTCEQVLGEVMAIGVEPVVFNNLSENYIVSGYGRVSTTENEYIENIIDIYSNPTNNEKVIKLKKRASELYSIDDMIKKWSIVFKEMMNIDKKERHWRTHINNVGSEMFIESLGDYGDILKTGTENEILDLFNTSYQWKSKSKGSVFQYLEAFPNDERLIKWSKLIKEEV